MNTTNLKNFVSKFKNIKSKSEGPDVDKTHGMILYLEGINKSFDKLY